MPYILPKSVMLHIPKTAGLWAREALRNAGVPFENWRQHSDLVPADAPDFRFAFVRRPDDWLRSFYGYHSRRGWRDFDDSPVFAMFALRGDGGFPGFVARYLEKMPGAVGRLFDRYTADCNYVGRTETIHRDLPRALSLAGESFNARAIERRTRGVNVNPDPPAWPPALHRAFLDAEWEAFERWGYGHAGQ